MTEKFQQQAKRNVHEEVREEDGKQVRYICFRGVLKYRADNPRFVEKPKGKDTRTDIQKRRTIWREVTTNLECRKGRSQKQTDAAMNEVLGAWREKMEKEAQTPDAARVTVASFAADFVANKKVSSKTGMPLSPTTRDNYAHALKLIDRPQLDVPLKDVEDGDIINWLRALEEEGKGASISSKAFRLLRLALNSAKRRKLIKVNPCDNIEAEDGKPVPNKPEVNGLDKAGADRLNTLLDTLGHTQLADCARMALLTGMRAGEICGLRWQDVDGWRDGTLTALNVCNVIARQGGRCVTKPCPKNGKPRKIAINNSMRELLAYRLGVMRKKCAEANTIMSGEEYVFGEYAGEDGKGFLSPNYLSKLWRQFAQANNIVGVKGYLCTFHSLRHTYAIVMLSSGEPDVNVAQVLGHAKSDITKRIYFEWAQDGAESTQERAGELLSGRAEQPPVAKFGATGTEG